MQNEGRYAGKLNPSEVVERSQCKTPDAAKKLLVDTFLQDDVSDELADALATAVQKPPSAPTGDWLREFTVAVVTLPEFHLS